MNIEESAKRVKTTVVTTKRIPFSTFSLQVARVHTMNCVGVDAD